MNLHLLSHIRILEADQIYLFEDIKSSGVEADVDLDQIDTIRHPFLATPMKDGLFLLLEDSHYFTALIESGLKHLPVQVCSPDSISVQAAKLGFVNLLSSGLKRIVARYPDQISIVDAQNGTVKKGELLFEFDILNDRKIGIAIRHDCRRGCPDGLRNIFYELNRISRMVPIDDNDFTGQGATCATNITVNLSMPSFALSDLEQAALSGTLFPEGLVKIAVPLRLLEIDLPVSVLNSQIDNSEKELFLKDLLLIRRQARRTSVYHGQVVLLNSQAP